MSHHNNRSLEGALSPRQEAQLNVSAIMDYWHSKGHTEVTARVREEQMHDPSARPAYFKIYRIETNLRGGLPPSLAPKPKPKPVDPDDIELSKLAESMFSPLEIEQIQGRKRDQNTTSMRKSFIFMADKLGKSQSAIARFLKVEPTAVRYHLKGAL